MQGRHIYSKIFVLHNQMCIHVPSYEKGFRTQFLWPINHERHVGQQEMLYFNYSLGRWMIAH
jgi:hypothetical protein